ncbi:MAG TPA: YciI family protein [Solirubrobacteraceae bacterium]|jgi:hypothetical protein|nr:YciI family protein [Solirubrobacteraceae bacterium]
MEYLIQIYTGDPAGWEDLPEDERAAISREYMQINEHPGVRGGAQLAPAESATTVRVHNGGTLTTDGPFAETKEALGGYWVLEADDLDGAIEFAARIPAARLGGAVEVRPLVSP